MSQVHRSAAAGSRSRGRVQPRTCFEEPERMFDIEAAQERLPAAVHLVGGGARAGGP